MDREATQCSHSSRSKALPRRRLSALVAPVAEASGFLFRKDTNPDQ